MTATAQTYEANDLTALEGLEAVRKRPGMYIGSTDSRGITHLSYEIVDNSVDEALAGHASLVTVTVRADNSLEVKDNGRGIPTDAHNKSGLSGVELVLTKLHAGGKFGGSGYKTSGGLHGVGASVVNELSLRLDATVAREGKIHTISFKHGVAGVFTGDSPTAQFIPQSGLRVTGKALRGMTGTTIRYWYDAAYFNPGSEFQFDALIAKCRNTAFLVPGLTIALRDERGETPVEEKFCFPGGLKDMVEFNAPTGDRPVSDTLMFTGVGRYKENAADENGVMQTNVERTCEVEVALRWGTGYEAVVEPFTNVVRNAHGGTHRKGFERGLARTMVEALKGTRGLLKPTEDAPTLEDCLEGMTVVIHVKVPEPQFTSQTKDELSTAGVTRAVQDVVAAGLKAFIEDRKTKVQARAILEKIVAAARVRLTQKQQKDAARRKTALEGASMPAKLVDCRSTNVARSEIFLVEGDSALGSARKGRIAEYQALLPLRGKVLNVQKASVSDAMKNIEITSIIQVLGAGFGRSFDLEQMRYGRVMIMADADVDGSHIRCLLITLFAKYLRPVIESGRLFAAMPPLHKITTKGRNAETIFTYTAAEMEATVARIEGEGRTVVTPIPRFKGLGEMDAEELWATTMNPVTRSVRRITLEDVEDAEASLELLMGSEVPPRRDWLVEYADQIDREAIDA